MWGIEGFSYQCQIAKLSPSPTASMTVSYANVFTVTMMIILSIRHIEVFKWVVNATSMKLQLTLTEFVELALAKLREQYAGVGDAVFMSRYGSEPDSECHTMPDYVLVDIGGKDEEI